MIRTFVLEFNVRIRYSLIGAVKIILNLRRQKLHTIFFTFSMRASFFWLVGGVFDSSSIDKGLSTLQLASRAYVSTFLISLWHFRNCSYHFKIIKSTRGMNFAIGRSYLLTNSKNVLENVTLWMMSYQSPKTQRSLKIKCLEMASKFDRIVNFGIRYWTKK